MWNDQLTKSDIILLRQVWLNYSRQNIKKDEYGESYWEGKYSTERKFIRGINLISILLQKQEKIKFDKYLVLIISKEIKYLRKKYEKTCKYNKLLTVTDRNR